MRQVYALVKGGKVVNTIVANQEFVDAIVGDWDAVVEITSASPMPGRDWDHDGTNFTDNRYPEPE